MNGKKLLRVKNYMNLQPTFEVDGKAFTYDKYDKRTPGLFKVE
jgi:hypothetical protein